MTLHETRQLGIEFERRVQTMIPETEYFSKLDTETIYSYINQYQDKLIDELYRTIDQIPVSNNETYLETLLQSMHKGAILNISGTKDDQMNEVTVNLPSNFGLYISSYTNVSETYEYKPKAGNIAAGALPNTLIAYKDLGKVLQKPYDGMRILRSPIVWLNSDNSLGAVYDRYTKPVSIKVDYYRRPNYMDLMTSTPCELPMEMFEQLVSGAVDLYVQYVAGAEARKRLMQELQQRNNRRNNEDDERS